MNRSENKLKKGQDAPLTPEAEKEKPPASTRDLFIDSNTGTNEETLKKFLPIVEMVVKKEYRTMPSYLAEYSELINIGLLTVHKLLHDVKKNNKTYNSSYIAQAIKWAIKDELRSKYNWYGVKQTQGKNRDSDDDDFPREVANEEDVHAYTSDEVREKMFETIL